MCWLLVIPPLVFLKQHLPIAPFVWICNGMRKGLLPLVCRNLDEKRAEFKPNIMLVLPPVRRLAASHSIMVVNYGCTNIWLLMMKDT